jgi:alpha-L-fucosidase
MFCSMEGIMKDKEELEISEESVKTEQIKEIRKKMIEEGVHNFSTQESYVTPMDTKVLQKLEWFKDQKLALMLHWGAYSQIGIVESWALSDADAYWSRNCIDWEVTGEEFKRQYFDLNKTFNPIRFQPEKWAETAEEAGIRYMIFTTKHHDGFCMWDTKCSDYKITAQDCPFHTNRYADVCTHLFEAFRKKGIGIAAYFSKADWHIDSYWSDKYERGNYQCRGPSYHPLEHPQEWERFVQYTHNQILELGCQYGKIDIMWFDGGWVCKENNQDIRLGEVIEKVRTFQPGMLCADRTVGGLYENYVTPEQCVPVEPLDIPWESCITLGTSFSFAYEDTYKSPREVVSLLVDIVAKGGNLAINVGPQPDGRLPKGAVKSLKGLGAWLNIYGDAIYSTRVCAPYKKNGIAFTRNAQFIYAIQVFEDEKDRVSSEIFIPYEGNVTEIVMLDNMEQVKFDRVENGYQIHLSKNQEEIAPIARVFRLQ